MTNTTTGTPESREATDDSDEENPTPSESSTEEAEGSFVSVDGGQDDSTTRKRKRPAVQFEDEEEEEVEPMAPLATSSKFSSTSPIWGKEGEGASAAHKAISNGRSSYAAVFYDHAEQCVICGSINAIDSRTGVAEGEGPEELGS